MRAAGPFQLLADRLRPDSALWRRAMAAGVSFGPDPWVRYSPPFFGWAFPYMHRDKEQGGSGKPGGLDVGMNGSWPYPLLTFTF